MKCVKSANLVSKNLIFKPNTPFKTLQLNLNKNSEMMP